MFITITGTGEGKEKHIMAKNGLGYSPIRWNKRKLSYSQHNSMGEMMTSQWKKIEIVFITYFFDLKPFDSKSTVKVYEKLTISSHSAVVNFNILIHSSPNKQF